MVSVLPYVAELESVEQAEVPEWLSHWPDHYEDTDWVQDGDVSFIETGLGELTKRYGIWQQRDSLNHSSKTECVSAQTLQQSGIQVIGASQNNLKNLSVCIPENKITVVTGVSGSGKSSLVFDTIYAESQRRFFTHMNLAGMEQMEKPKVEAIYGLPPAVAIAQTEASNQPKSTVGTYTEVYDLLCKIYAVAGVRYCPVCSTELNILTEDEIAGLLDEIVSCQAVELSSYGEEQWIAYAGHGKN